MLYLVGTPIGHLKDISLHALEILKQVDLIAAEDTRHSSILLRHYEIQKPVISFHEHNEARRTQELVTRLQEGAHVAVITDAGLPGISDPGARLVRACIQHGLPYTVIPGPSAVPIAVIGSGFSTENGFYFGGFLPTKSGQRERTLREAIERKEVSIFFESPYRIVRTLEVLAQWAPERKVCVARELTKQFEEFRHGLPAELVAHFTAHPPKGEFCVVLDQQP